MNRQHPAATRRLPMASRSRWLACAALAGTAVLPLAGCGAGPPSAGGPAARVAPAGSRPAAGPRAITGPPRYFADIVPSAVNAAGPLQIRESATGKLVAQDRHVTATGVAALAGGRTFVLAEQAAGSCATRLYRLRLNDRGHPGRPSPLHLPRLHGQVASLAASADGRLVGLAIGGCAKGSRGYLAVVHVRSGRIRRWSGLDIGGVTNGNVALNGALSMPANGRLLAFPAFRLAADSKITQQEVRVLPADARAGSVARRSRVVRGRRYPPYHPLLAAAALSPGGGTLYSCEVLGPAGRAIRIAAYRTRSGRLRRTIARLTVTASARPVTGSCPIAADRRGRYLLVPYSVRYPKNPGALSVLRVALAAVASGRVRLLKVRLPGGTGGMSPVTGLSIAW